MHTRRGETTASTDGRHTKVSIKRWNITSPFAASSSVVRKSRCRTGMEAALWVSAELFEPAAAMVLSPPPLPPRAPATLLQGTPPGAENGSSAAGCRRRGSWGCGRSLRACSGTDPPPSPPPGRLPPFSRVCLPGLSAGVQRQAAVGGVVGLLGALLCPPPPWVKGSSSNCSPCAMNVRQSAKES